MSPFRYLVILLIITAPCIVSAQDFLGVGLHVSPPVRFDNCCNPWVKARPVITPAFSFTYRRMWENGRGKGWYGDFGFTFVGLKFNVQEFFNDTIQVWHEFGNRHMGFPSVLLGFGRSFIFKEQSREREFTLGLECSYRIAHSLGYFHSKNFGLDYFASDLTFPFFLRLNAGYGAHARLWGRMPVYWQIYAKFSPQDIARGPQYIVDPVGGTILENGKYRLNNSEIGMKIFADMHLDWNKPNRARIPRAKRDSPIDYRISLEAQTYVPSSTRYYIPQVDSFSLNGLSFSLTQQLSLKTEIYHFRNQDWSTVLGIGLGRSMYTTHFRAQSSFSREGEAINSPKGGIIGQHLIPQFGFALKRPWKNVHFQHTLSATFVVPLGKENANFLVIEKRDPTIPSFDNVKTLSGSLDYSYGRDRVLYGVEYQPEALFHSDKKFFYALGLVFNYSGGVLANGRAVVDNGRTRYYGGVIQGFSKIGVTLRVGLNAAK
jgi:hypothetical protein